MSYDDWKTTDPNIEAECESCGLDPDIDGHEYDCPNFVDEPNYEAMIEPEEEDPKR